MPFGNRAEAGQSLAAALTGYRDQNPVILAAVGSGGGRGCRGAHGPLDLILAQVGVPFEPELAMGAIVDVTRLIVRNEDVIRHAGVEEADFNAVCDAEFSEIERRRKRYIGVRDRAKVEGCTAIVIDDGIATGATMRRITMNWGLNNAPGILSLHRPDECRGF